MENSNQNIPPQRVGEKSDVIHCVDFGTRESAHHLFMLAKDRLKNVSNWHLYSGPGSSKFGLTDGQGKEIFHEAEAGDHFFIDLPAPGSIAGGGLEWVRIEKIEEGGDASTESEYIAIRVRPGANPRNPGEEIAHFFDHQSTSTFVVERFQTQVCAAVHGRNEVPNNSDTNIYDSIRNTMIALGARSGLSGPQWEALIEGLLKTE